MDSLRRKKPPLPLPPKPQVSPRENPASKLPLAAKAKPRFHSLGETESVFYTTPLSPPTESKAPATIFNQRKWLPKIVWGVLLALGLLFFAGVAFLLYEGFAVTQSIRIDGNSFAAPTLTEKLRDIGSLLVPGKRTPLRGEDRGRINVLLLGKAGEGLPGESLTDTIMLASIDTRTNKIALLSLPRDLYKENVRGASAGKINSLYQQGRARGTGIQPLATTVTAITGQEVDYFFVIDFAGFEQVINAIGGIFVEVPKDFYDPRYPGKNFSYETFELKKGWQKLDGATALKYVRERHDDPEGDFGRAKRQQQTLEAVRDKTLSPGTLLNFLRVHRLFQSVEKNVETNLSLSEMQSFYQLASTLDTQNVTNVVLDAWKPESLLRVDHIILAGTRSFILVPRTGNWEETRGLAENIFTLDALQKRKSLLQNEQARVVIADPGETLQGAEKLAAYLRRELSVEVTVVYSPQLDKQTELGMLYQRSAKEKPYTFDELSRRLPVTRSSSFLSLPSPAPNTDFIITMSPALASVFQNADEFLNPNKQPGFDQENLTP
jgi:LCP family protein required for cell wall assembly